MTRTTKQILADQQAQADRDRQRLPAIASPTRSAHERYLDEIAPSGIVGRLIKFTKDGVFAFSDNGEKVSPEEDFIAICDQTLISFVRFNEDHQPPDRIGGLLYNGFELPVRETLGDNDPAYWSIGLDGKPEDPWKHEILLVLKRPMTLELATFSTVSNTGRRAVGNLLRHYDRLRLVDAYPVVRLRPGGFQHRDTRIGWVATPEFAIVGRSVKETAAIPDTSAAAQLDDEIPF